MGMPDVDILKLSRKELLLLSNARYDGRITTSDLNSMADGGAQAIISFGRESWRRVVALKRKGGSIYKLSDAAFKEMNGIFGK